MTSHGLSPEDYLDPEVPHGLPWIDVPVVDGRDPSLAGMVRAVADHSTFDVPIVPWPVTGNRPLDPGTGIEGGTTEGTFTTRWQKGRLMADNAAVGGRYVIGFADPPGETASTGAPTQVLLWHVNHHPDGGQLFWSLDRRPFLVPVLPVGPDPVPAAAVAARSDGTFGICVLPGVWHDGVYPESGDGDFGTRQGRVHARVSADLAGEFGLLLRVPLA